MRSSLILRNLTSLTSEWSACLLLYLFFSSQSLLRCMACFRVSATKIMHFFFQSIPEKCAYSHNSVFV